MDYNAKSKQPATKEVVNAQPESDRVEMTLPVFLPGNNRNWEEVAGQASIEADGRILIALQKDEDAKELIEMAKIGALYQLSFDYKMTKEQLAEIDKMYQVDAAPKEFVDEKTLQKVLHTFIEFGITESGASDLINALQNKGILFRERV